MRAELYWIADASYGRLAIASRPRAGDWLVDELPSWQTASVDVIVSLLTEDEVGELDLQRESTLCSEIGLTFLSHPICDRGVPSSTGSFLGLVEQLDDYLRDGRSVAIADKPEGPCVKSEYNPVTNTAMR